MKRFILASALLTGGTLALPSHSYAHGGVYHGPGDTVPPAGGGPNGGPEQGPSAPGPNGPGSRTGGSSSGGLPIGPGGTPGGPGTGEGTGAGGDLTAWQFWWEFNKRSYMNLKSRVQSGLAKTGSDTHFLGQGALFISETLAPTRAQIQQQIVPALRQVLADESNNDIITGALIALAKIGDVASENGKSELEAVIAAFLKDDNIEISETAAVSLGILASPGSIETLEHLLSDSQVARSTLVKAAEVPYRIRAFAAYGLGLIAARTGEDMHKRQVVDILARAIENDDTRSRDLKVACIISMGLAPISEVDAELEEGQARSPSACRDAQIQFLYDYLNDRNNQALVRAHCPTALARLVPANSENETLQAWRTKLSLDFKERCSRKSKERNEVIQSAIIGLGLLGDNGSEGLAPELRLAIMAVPRELKDQQARNFSMIAAAKAGGTAGEGDRQAGIAETTEFLIHELTRGKKSIRPWAGLAIGVMGAKLSGQDGALAQMESAAKVLRENLAKETNPSRLGAYAIAAGIMRDEDSTPILMKRLSKLHESNARGYVCVSLALMGAAEAKDPLREIVSESLYNPILLNQAATALGLLGDKDVVPMLTEMMSETSSLAGQAALSSALGTIGDKRSVDPLIALLLDKDANDGARGFAAVSLGIVADKELLPWNAKIAEDLNYRASTSTLVDSAGASGILDIL